MALLIDFEHVPVHVCDGALDYIAKAMGDEPPGDDIWRPHESPFIRHLIELFTLRGLTRIENVRSALAAWMSGANSKPRPELDRPARPPGAMTRWTPEELELARLYLEALPSDAWTLEDYALMVDWVVQRYLPPDDLRTEAQWMAQRAVLMGRMQAALPDAAAAQADRVMASDSAPPATAQMAAILEYGRIHAAELVQDVADSARRRLKAVVLGYEQSRRLGDRAATPASLQTQLQDQFGGLNRDWRRIALTEASELSNQGFVAANGPGTLLKRLEHYSGACSFCRKIDGTVVTVVDPSAPDKNGETQVWPGKTNVGRSAAPRKRVGDHLVDREPHERFWIAAGTQHPHCRGQWLRQPNQTTRPGDDPEFASWLRELLAPKD